MSRGVAGAWAVWIREITVFRRERARVVASLAQPLMWIFLFGGGLGGSGVGGGGATEIPAGLTYQQYIYPGILMMSALFSSMFYGLYVVWDRKIDVLKEILVAPVSRGAVFAGKVAGGCSEVVIQATVLLVLGHVLFGVPGADPLVRVPAALGAIALATVGTVSIGLCLGSLFESMEGFQVVNTFLSFPLFFLSGALFPVGESLRRTQPFVYYAARLDPVTYAVDLLREILLGAGRYPPVVDLAVLAAFGVLMNAVGALAFRRMRL